MPDKTYKIPSWGIMMILSIIVTLFTAGWVKIEDMQKKLCVEEIHRTYVIDRLDKIDKTTYEILKRLRYLEKD